MKARGEEALREPVRGFLAAGGWEVFDEIPIAARVADLVGVRGAEVVAVELKLAAWRAALVQAKAYQLGAGTVYVALPLPLTARLGGPPPAFSAEGIGLLGVAPGTGEVRELLAPRPSPRLLPFLSAAVIDRARAGAEPLSPALASLLADLWEALARGRPGADGPAPGDPTDTLISHRGVSARGQAWWPRASSSSASSRARRRRCSRRSSRSSRS